MIMKHNMLKTALAGLVTLCAPGYVAAETGYFGGWAADSEDCKYVSDRKGVTQNVTAAVITPDNVFIYEGECYFTDVAERAGGIKLTGQCDEGDGPYDTSLEMVLTGANTMRALWPEMGWTTFHRCWDLPADWDARVKAAQ